MLPIKIELPEHFLDEEVRDGIIVTKEKKEVWAVQIDLFCEFKRICDKYNLRYWADAGTLLGSVRHGGYIPWDDDMDFSMFRDDYEKFLEVCKYEIRSPYFVQTSTTDLGYHYAGIRFMNTATTCIARKDLDKDLSCKQGIFIDILPLDYLPDDEVIGKRTRINYFKEMEIMRKTFYSVYLATVGYDEHNRRFAVPNLLLQTVIEQSGLDPKCLMRDLSVKCDNYYKRYHDLSNSKFMIMNYIIGWRFRRKYLTEWFNSFEQFKFEFVYMSIPVCYDKILTERYGDWRTPVKDASIHGKLIFDCHTSYTDFNKSSYYETDR